ncbi:Protein SCAI [Bienertia sinuspersici]
MALRNGGVETQDTGRAFRALVEKADRKFSRVRDLPAYGPGPNPGRYLNKVFKAYMKLWKYQRENRAKLVGSGLQRWEIGEIASRIGQLYFGQYMRSSEARFLLESYVFYEAILNRGYFQSSGSQEHGHGGGGISVRFKELRFYARFLLVALILNRRDVVALLVDRFKALVDDSRATFRDTNFKEWRQVVQEIVRFVNADKQFPNARPLRYCAMFDTHPDSMQIVSRFHAKKVLKLKEAVLTSYHRNEVKFAEMTLDTYRMLQCLEWESSGSFYQKHQNEPIANGVHKDFSGTSGLIDINLAADLTDPTLPPNPRKAVLYRPTATHILAIIATMCEELPPDSIMLIYVSSSLETNTSVSAESSGGSRRFSKSKVVISAAHDQHLSPGDSKKGYLSGYYDESLCLSPRGIRGVDLTVQTTSILEIYYPSPEGLCSWLLIVITAMYSRQVLMLFSYYLQVIHGSERGEPSALLLSPSRPSFKSPNVDATEKGSQFTMFLTAPLLAFCQLVGLSESDRDADIYDEAENIIADAFAKWEVLLCSSTKIDLVWAQVLPDPFLRRIILRFIFCRAVLFFSHSHEMKESFMPACLPHLPGFVSPDSEAIASFIYRLADHLKVSDCFYGT